MTVYTPTYLNASVFDTRGTPHITPANMRDLVESLADPGVLKASADPYLVSPSRTATQNTTGLNAAIAELLSNDNYHTLLIDSIGTISINGDIMFEDARNNPARGGRYSNKQVRGLMWNATKILQTDATKSIFRIKCNSGGPAFSDNSSSNNITVGIDNDDTTLTFSSTTAFPDPTDAVLVPSGSYAISLSGGGVQESMLVTAKSGTTLTVVRGQGGTTGQTFAIGTPVTMGIDGAWSFSHCGITDLYLAWSSVPTRATGHQAYGIAWENSQQFSKNAMFFCFFDRLFIESTFIAMGIRPREYRWQPGMAVSVGDWVIPSAGEHFRNGWTHRWRVTTGGTTSATTEPTWSQSAGAVVNDAGGPVYLDGGKASGAGNNDTASYMTVWGMSIATTFIRIHDCQSQALQWSNGQGVGQPENVIGNMYLQNRGLSTASVEPAVEFENVEITIQSLGIEDWKNKCMRMNGDEQVEISLFHLERITIDTAVISNVQSALVIAKANSLIIHAMRSTTINGSNVTGYFFDFRSTGYLWIGSMIEGAWTNMTNTYLLNATAVSGVTAPESWGGNHHRVVAGGASSLKLYNPSNTNAADSLDQWNGSYYGGCIRVVPVSTANILSTYTPGMTITKGTILATPASSITGVILTAGNHNQKLTIVNGHATNTITFAADATSLVAGGTGIVIAGNKSMSFVYDAVAGRWKPESQ